MTNEAKIVEKLKYRFEGKPELKTTNMYQGKKRQKPMSTGEWEKRKRSFLFKPVK